MVFGIFYHEYEHFDTKAKRFTGEKYMDEACGSDSVFILDGRNRMAKWIQDMRERAMRLRNVKPNYAAFKIMRGDILHAHPISGLITIKAA